MTDAPERIYMDPDIRFHECEKEYGCDVEYIRADIAEAEIERLRAEVGKWLADAKLMLGFADLAYEVGAYPTSSELLAAKERALGRLRREARVEFASEILAIIDKEAGG